MPLEDDFSDITKKARQGQGLTVEQVAGMTGLATRHLADLESGRRPPRPNEIEAIARCLVLRAQPLLDIALGGWQPAALPSLTGLETIVGDIGGYAVKGYLLYDPATRDAVIIDTGYNASGMLQIVKRRDLRLTAVCLTHGHVDHAGGLDRLLEFSEAPVYIGAEDVSLLHWRPRTDLLHRIAVANDGEVIRVGALAVKLMVTPGHTPGGLCYRVTVDGKDVCFVGDTLFAGSIGRANPVSLYPRHLESVRERLLRLPQETLLLPGHGPSTTVAEELRFNPFAKS
jgi:hydroxyacylglutathione hydrolase